MFTKFIIGEKVVFRFSGSTWYCGIVLERSQRHIAIGTTHNMLVRIEEGQPHELLSAHDAIKKLGRIP